MKATARPDYPLPLDLVAEDIHDLAEARRLVKRALDMLHQAKGASPKDQALVQAVGHLHQRLLARRGVLKAAAPPATPAPQPLLRNRASTWFSDVLDRPVALRDLDVLSPQEQVLLRAELKSVIGSIDAYIERAGLTGDRATNAERKRSIAESFLEVLEALNEAGPPRVASPDPQEPAASGGLPDLSLDAIFRQVVRQNVDHATYQRLVLISEQRRLVELQRLTGMALNASDLPPTTKG